MPPTMRIIGKLLFPAAFFAISCVYLSELMKPQYVGITLAGSYVCLIVLIIEPLCISMANDKIKIAHDIATMGRHSNGKLLRYKYQITPVGNYKLVLFKNTFNLANQIH